MEELGLKLKHVREARGVSLRDIAARTKISVNSLEALERDEFDRLPGGIFSRSVVRAYATEVGLDPDTTVENFLVYARRHERERAERVAATRPDVTRDDREYLARQRHAVRVLRHVAVLVALSGVSLLAWQVRRIWTPADATTPTAATRDAAPTSPPAPPPADPVEPASPPAPEPAAVVPAPAPPPPAETTRPRAAVVAEGERPEGTAPEPVEPSPAFIRTAAVTAAPDVPTASALVLHLTAQSDCEITVVRDGGPMESQVLRAGGRLRLDATSDVVLTVADAGAVTWRINGRAAKPLGRAGTEVSVRVTLQNAAEFLR